MEPCLLAQLLLLPSPMSSLRIPPFPIVSELSQVPARANSALTEPVNTVKEQQVEGYQVSSPFPQNSAQGRRIAWETAAWWWSPLPSPLGQGLGVPAQLWGDRNKEVVPAQ